jgi:hypothetical protein
MQSPPLRFRDQKFYTHCMLFYSYVIDVLSFRVSGFVRPNIFHEEYVLFTSSISMLPRDSDIPMSEHVSYRFVLKKT